MAFVRRSISITFTLGEGTYGETSSNSVTLSGLRVSATIENAGGRAMGTADVRIYGMTQSMMNQLSTLGMVVTTLRRNTIQINAGDYGGVLSEVFQGTIYDAYIDFSNMPDVFFHVTASCNGDASVYPNTPISYDGDVDAATLLSSLATKMGLSFENNGVSETLSYPYYAGTLRAQADKIVRDAGIEWNGGANGVLAIWYPGEARGSSAITVSPDTGMVGYPDYSSLGLTITHLFNPNFGLGAKISVESSLPNAVGEWVITKLSHNLESELPGGRWFSQIEVARAGITVVHS